MHISFVDPFRFRTAACSSAVRLNFETKEKEEAKVVTLNLNPCCCCLLLSQWFEFPCAANYSFIVVSVTKDIVWLKVPLK